MVAVDKLTAAFRAAAALGLSTQQVTQDWSDVNYSSARAALLRPNCLTTF